MSSDPNYFYNLLNNNDSVQSRYPSQSTDPNFGEFDSNNASEWHHPYHVSSDQSSYIIPTQPQLSETPNIRSQYHLSNTSSGSRSKNSRAVNLVPVDVTATTTTSNRRNPWSPDDDQVLISAFLNTSKDSVVGTDQSANTFWGKVENYFNLYKKTQINRDKMACKNRWHSINGQVSKFVGAYKQANGRKKSGESENDVILCALKIFEADNGKKFNLIHAWYLLRNDAKWLCYGEESSSKRTKNNSKGHYSSSSEPGTPGTPNTPNTPGHININAPAPLSEDANDDDVEVMTRPIGVKAAKRKSHSKSKQPTEAEASKLDMVHNYMNVQSKMTQALENSSRMKTWEMYSKLIAKEVLSEREEKFLKFLEEQIFPK